MFIVDLEVWEENKDVTSISKIVDALERTSSHFVFEEFLNPIKVFQVLRTQRYRNLEMFNIKAYSVRFNHLDINYILVSYTCIL